MLIELHKPPLRDWASLKQVVTEAVRLLAELSKHVQLLKFQQLLREPIIVCCGMHRRQVSYTAAIAKRVPQLAQHAARQAVNSARRLR